jgi:hypothetical protein
MSVLMLTSCKNSSTDTSEKQPPATVTVQPTVTTTAPVDYPLTAAMGEFSENNFFKFKVTDADLHYEVNGKIPENASLSILRVSFEVVNKTTEGLPIGAGDFLLNYGEESSKPLGNIVDGQFPVNYQLAAGETLTGDLFYRVPVEQTNFALEYTEVLITGGISEKGKTYSVIFSADLQDEINRVGEIRKNASFRKYLYFTSDDGIVKTQKFSFNVESYTVSNGIFQVKANIITDVSDKDIQISSTDWALYQGNENKLLYCISGGEYMSEKEYFSPGSSYSVTLGFETGENFSEDDVFILEYTEQNFESNEIQIYGLGL